MHDGIDGLLVPVGESPVLAAAIRRLLGGQAERRRIADAGRQQIIEGYQFASLADATEQVLAGVCR
jgi:glycosyltransferase involved in cell wall biosynthesis